MRACAPPGMSPGSALRIVFHRPRRRKQTAVREPYSDRRYTDEETRLIFQVAAESEVAGERVAQSREGLTLAELREIAEEVGIDPAAVERAAADVVARDESDRLADHSPFDRVLHEEVTIARPLSDIEMRRIAMQAEAVLGRHGALREAGDWVEWRDPKDKLYVGMVRGGHQTRIRVIADYSAEIAFGAAAIGVMGTLLGMSLVGSGSVQGLTLGAIAIVAAPVLIGWFWRRRSESGRRDLRELLAILEAAIR